MTQIFASAGAAAILLTPLASATPDITGMMGNHPAGLLVGGSGASNSVVIRDGGTVSGPPLEWTSATYGTANPNHPDYSMSALTANAWAGVEFNSMSQGTEIIPGVLSDGRMPLSGSLWFALDVTVGATATGTPGSPIRKMATTGGGAAGSIFSYTAEGSGGISGAYVDSAMVEQTARQVGYVGNVPEIRGLDWGIGVESANFTGGSPMFMPSKYFYFTVTPSFVASTQNGGASTILVPNPETGGSENLNAVTIYRMEWNRPGTPGQWSAPEVFLNFFELGLVPWEESIDGLTLTQRNDRHRVIFSTGPGILAPITAPVRNQILVFERDYSQPFGTGARITVQTQPLRTGSGVNFSTKVGLNPPQANDPDNVKGLCGRDPEAGADLNRAVAIPKYVTGTSTNQSQKMGLAVSRRHTVGTQTATNEFRIEASGFDLTGYDTGLICFQLGAAVPPMNGSPLPQPSLSILEVVPVKDGDVLAVADAVGSLQTGLLGYVRASLWIEKTPGTLTEVQESAVNVIID